MQLSQKNFFSGLFVPFPKSVSHLEHFEKNMTLEAFVYSKLRTVKDVVR